MRKNIRFLKKIIILCLIINIIITSVALFICITTNEISAGILGELLGAWSIELGLSAFIKNLECGSKNIKTENIKTENEDKTKDSI